MDPSPTKRMYTDTEFSWFEDIDSDEDVDVAGQASDFRVKDPGAAGLVESLRFDPDGAFLAPHKDDWAHQFVHEPLPKGSWTRILRLEPGLFHESIRCSIHPLPLRESTGRYDALSYVWGLDSPSRWILVHGRPLAIHNNLFQFLKHPRRENKSLDVWADATCIDQCNTLEKNHQVQQMRHIYRNSRATRVWLGEVTANINRLFGVDRTLHGAHARLRDAMSLKDRNRDWDVRRGRALLNIMKLEYWNRLWIVQEVLLSPMLEFHMCTINRGAAYGFNEFVHICQAGSAYLPQCKMISLLSQRQSYSNRSLLELLKAYGTKHCNDIRDRVYGLLGLANDIELEVDYNLSTMSLFERVIRAYDPQFIDELPLFLASALELSQASPIHRWRGDTVVPIRARKCGFILISNSHVSWNPQPETSLSIQQIDKGNIKEGDDTYTISSTRETTLPNLRNFFFCTRSCIAQA